MNIEMSELGGRPQRMVELYNLAGTIYDEVTTAIIAAKVSQMKLRFVIKSNCKKQGP